VYIIYGCVTGIHPAGSKANLSKSILCSQRLGFIRFLLIFLRFLLHLLELFHWVAWGCVSHQGWLPWIWKSPHVGTAADTLHEQTNDLKILG